MNALVVLYLKKNLDKSARIILESSPEMKTALGMLTESILLATGSNVSEISEVFHKDIPRKLSLP